MTAERFTKQGETRQATPEDHLWIKGLLRYTRNVEMVTPDPSGWGANITTMFGGLTFRYRPGRLCLLFNSYPSTDHARYITEEHARAMQSDTTSRPNVNLHIANTFSKEVTLRMQARACELTNPNDIAEGLLAYNAVRRMKGENPISLEPNNEEDSPRALYVAEVLFADTQGERYTKRGNHVGEGHPVLNIAELEGYEEWPSYLVPHTMPNNKEELQYFLRSVGAQ